MIPVPEDPRPDMVQGCRLVSVLGVLAFGLLVVLGIVYIARTWWTMLHG